MHTGAKEWLWSDWKSALPPHDCWHLAEGTHVLEEPVSKIT